MSKVDNNNVSYVFVVNLALISHGGLGKPDKPVDLALSCVDNFEARMAINQVGLVNLAQHCTHIYV